MTVAARLVERWRGQQLAIRPGNAAAELAAFERRHAVRLPQDFREYLQQVDGMGDDLDNDLYCFWPLARIVATADYLSAHSPDRELFPGCFVFADWCIDAAGFAIQLAGERDIGHVFALAFDGRRHPAIALSFTGFVDAYLHDRDRLFPKRRTRS